MNKETVCIMGISVSVCNMETIVSYIVSNQERLKGNYICLMNAHTMVMAYENQFYKRVQRKAIFNLPDGKPIVVFSRLKGHTKAERVAGPDLMEQILKESEKKGYRHFFYGGTENSLKILKRRLKQNYPLLEIAGMYSPPFRKLSDSEEAEVTSLLKKSKADFIWVGLGAPKQEIFMYRHQHQFDSIMLGVGAAFDFHGGMKKRAPKWMQTWCLEWFYRFLQEPKRLWKRYFYYNWKFIYYMIQYERKRKN